MYEERRLLALLLRLLVLLYAVIFHSYIKMKGELLWRCIELILYLRSY